MTLTRNSRKKNKAQVLEKAGLTRTGCAMTMKMKVVTAGVTRKMRVMGGATMGMRARMNIKLRMRT